MRERLPTKRGERGREREERERGRRERERGVSFFGGKNE
jgi:hypothetical protein